MKHIAWRTEHIQYMSASNIINTPFINFSVFISSHFNPPRPLTHSVCLQPPTSSLLSFPLLWTRLTSPFTIFLNLSFQPQILPSLCKHPPCWPHRTLPRSQWWQLFGVSLSLLPLCSFPGMPFSSHCLTQDNQSSLRGSLNPPLILHLSLCIAKFVYEIHFLPVLWAVYLYIDQDR